VKKKHKKSIKKRIILTSLLNVLIPVIILGIFTNLICYNISISYVLQNLESTANTAAGRISWQLKAYQNIALETGGNSRLTGADSSDADKQNTVNNIVAGYGFERGIVINASGIGLDGADYSSSEYFQQSMKGHAFVSDPFVHTDANGEMAIAITAPIWENSIFGGTVAGVVRFDPNEEFLNDITRDLLASANGSTYILNNKGTIIADPDTNIVREQTNITELAQSDSTYAELAKLHKRMVAQEAGSASIKVNGQTTLVGFAPIPDMNGWSIAVSAPSTDFLMATYLAMAVSLILIMLAAVIACIVSIRTGKSIGNPISVCAERLQQMIQGDLTSPVAVSNTDDEIGDLLRSMQQLQKSLNMVISDIDIFLDKFATGDFTASSTCPDSYVGDFSGIIQAMDNMKAKLTNTMRSIEDSANKVSDGAEQVSNSSQILAQGTTEQASTVERLSATSEDISTHINQTADYAKTALEGTNRTYDEIRICSTHMDDLMQAMTVINGKSSEISSVIKTIEDIAFQTNILALNAAVEAARAGAAGKGFSVVADEVRNLAGKCGEAAKSTATLIQETVKAVENGSMLSSETEQSLREVVENAQTILDAVTNISDAAHQQAIAVGQVSDSIQQISSVVQSNAASAEESAGASGELSQQASLLKQLVGQFQLPS